VLDGDPAPRPPRAQSPQFLAHVYFGQMSEWIKMPLSREVGLSPSNIVLDGDPAPPLPKGGRASQFSARVCCSQTAGWMKMPLGTEVDLSPGHIGICSPVKGAQQPPPLFGRCLLWPRSTISATAELLLVMVRKLTRLAIIKYLTTLQRRRCTTL